MNSSQNVNWRSILIRGCGGILTQLGLESEQSEITLTEDPKQYSCEFHFQSKESKWNRDLVSGQN